MNVESLRQLVITERTYIDAKKAHRIMELSRCPEDTDVLLLEDAILASGDRSERVHLQSADFMLVELPSR